MFNTFTDKHGNEWGSPTPHGDVEVISWLNAEAKAAYFAEVAAFAHARAVDLASLTHGYTL